ncbi:MAG: hypothetical protein SXV54_28260 [Chloroflexota bacterium]|nr:hypothetical protein [Chloroflexota bacterium]
MITNLFKHGILGVLISILVGATTWLITRDTLSSLIVSLGTETLILLIDLRSEIVDKFQDLSRAARLKDWVIGGTGEGEVVQDLIESYSAVLSDGEPFFIDRANEVVIETSNGLHNLRFGRMEVDSSLVQIKGAWILKHLHSSGFATALVRLDTFWFPESGQYYQDETLAAAKRGVPIVRVFLIDRQDVEISEAFLALMQEQADAGIDVRVAYTADLPPEIVADFGIWDEKIVGYVNTAPNSNKIVGATFLSTDAERLRARTMRDRILQVSVPLGDVIGTGS